MRILTVTHYFPAHGGGIEQAAARLIDEVVGSGAEPRNTVEWLASDSDPPPPDREGLRHLPVRTCNAIERRTHLPYPVWSLRDLSLVWRAIGRADVVHVHEFIYWGSLLTIIAARMRRRPVVLTQHTGRIRFTSPVLTWVYRALNRAVAALMLRMVQRVIFISHNTRRYFGMEHSPRGALAFNGVDTALFNAAPPEVREDYRRKHALSDRPAVLFVGRFVRKKGLRVLEKLARNCPDVDWIFAGAGPEDPLLWNCSNVRVPGHVTPGTLAELYNAADVLILPSFSEGFPLVVQEALACGLAVLSTEEVASACPPASSLIRTAPAPDEDRTSEAWEQALLALLGDHAWLSARIWRAQQAHGWWSWRICANDYLETFRTLSPR